MTNEEQQQLTIALLGYLPYRIKGWKKHDYSDKHSLYSLKAMQNGGGVWETVEEPNMIGSGVKPVLRPMSQLTQEISQANYNDGKPFVPMEVLIFKNKMLMSGFGRIDFELIKNGGIESLAFCAPAWVIDLLNQWMFNWRNLPDDLYVNIDTLPENPYS